MQQAVVYKYTCRSGCAYTCMFSCVKPPERPESDLNFHLLFFGFRFLSIFHDLCYPVQGTRYILYHHQLGCTSKHHYDAMLYIFIASRARTGICYLWYKKRAATEAALKPGNRVRMSSPFDIFRSSKRLEYMRLIKMAATFWSKHRKSAKTETYDRKIQKCRKNTHFSSIQTR